MRKFQVSGSSVFWWMKRSGILQNTGGRERGRRMRRVMLDVVNGRLGPPAVTGTAA